MLRRTETSYQEVTPTLDTNAYASGDHMGSLMEIPTPKEATTVRLKSIALVDKDDQGIALDVLLFNTQPTIASSDNAALSIADDELDKFAGSVAVAAADYIDATTGKAVSVTGIDLGIDPDKDNDKFYALLQAGGAGTFTASGVKLKFYFECERGYETN